jgi:deoxyribonuclease V
MVRSAGVLCCVDVDYRDHCVVAAAVELRDWPDATATHEEVLVSRVPPAPYEPGQFYRRELPYLLDLLARLPALPAVIIVDGLVWTAPDTPGLGAHLQRALGGRVAVVGVAKRPFHGNQALVPVLRGASAQPLFVSAVGMEVNEAARGVAAMHGPHRVPTLLKRVDRLARDTPAGEG